MSAAEIAGSGFCGAQGSVGRMRRNRRGQVAILAGVFVLGVTALAATLAPAVRAARIDPKAALQAEGSSFIPERTLATAARSATQFVVARASRSSQAICGLPGSR